MLQIVWTQTDCIMVLNSLISAIGRRDARLRALSTLGPLYYLILGILFMVINTAKKIFCSVLTFLDILVLYNRRNLQHYKTPIHTVLEMKSAPLVPLVKNLMCKNIRKAVCYYAIFKKRIWLQDISKSGKIHKTSLRKTQSLWVVFSESIIQTYCNFKSRPICDDLVGLIYSR